MGPKEIWKNICVVGVVEQKGTLPPSKSSIGSKKSTQK